MIENVGDQFLKIPYVDQNHFGLLAPDHDRYSTTDKRLRMDQTINVDSLASCQRKIHKRKTLVSIFMLACAWMSNDLVLAWVHERVPYNSDPLPDIWFSVFPEYQSAIKLTEALLIISLLCAISIMIFHRDRWLVTRRVFIVSALCYFGRAFCITLTQVPVPSRRTYCAPRANNTSAALILKRVGETISGLGMDTLTSPRELCGDLIYSGHTTILCLCFLTVSRYAPPKIQWLRYVSIFMALIGVIGILIARKHYTLDVVLAYYITTRVFWIYHTLADNKCTFSPTTKRPSMRSDVASVFWAPLIKFMETDMNQHSVPIVNQFDFPFKSSCQKLVLMSKKMAAKRPQLPLAVFSTSFWLRWSMKDHEDFTKRGTKSTVLLSV